MTDLGTLSGRIDDLAKICTMSSWTTEQLEEIERRLRSTIASVRQIRNEPAYCIGSKQRTSIRSTPDEILSMFFEQLPSEPEGEGPPDISYTFSVPLVCRRWRRVALTTPGLWRDIILGSMPDYVALETIRRRKTLPLFVWGQSLNTLTSLTDHHPSFASQLQRLVLDEPIIDSVDDLDWLHPDNLPNLEVLEVASSHMEPDGTPLHIWLADFQHLQSIDVKGVLPSWSTRAFPLSARTIHLDILGMGGSPTVAELFESLESLLHLHTLSFASDQIRDAHTVDRLVLPSLQRMEITVPHEDHKNVLCLLPLQRTHPYSLKLHIPRFCRRPHTATHPRDFYTNLETILQLRALPYTSIRIVIDDADLTLIFIDANLHSLSVTTRTQCGPEPNLLFEIVDPSNIGHVYLEQGRKPQSLLPCRRMVQDVVRLLTDTTELTIRNKVAHDSALILLGLAGAAGKFLFPHLKPYVCEWPDLHTISFEDVQYSYHLDDRSDQAARHLGQCLWAIKSHIVPFRRVELVDCCIPTNELSQWAKFIPEVHYTYDSNSGECMHSLSTDR